MRNLRLYSTEAAFQSYEESKGGDGVTTQTIVPGVSMSLTPRKRYFNPNDKTILVHTVTINYKDDGGQSVAESETKRFKYIPGVTQEVVVTPKNVSGYVMTNELPVVVTIPDDSVVNIKYISEEYEQMKHIPLTFEVLSSGNIRWASGSRYGGVTIEYKKNNDDWISIKADYNGYSTISVVSGDTVQFRGDNPTYMRNSDEYYLSSFRYTSCVFRVKGNIMSLVNSIEFDRATTLVSASTFHYLFRSCNGLIDASMLYLPATILSNSCYAYMFQNCSGLTSAPLLLPSTSLASSCYTGMFNGCTSLTTTPALNARILTNSCYAYMFQGCTSLTTTPALNATTLANSCYFCMFEGCSSLTGTSELPATILASRCYYYMFSNCTALTTAPEFSVTTFEPECFRGMFQGCTNLVSVNSIGTSATTMAASACTYMFGGCTSLTTAPALPATTLVDWCYYGMFEDCASLTGAPELPATNLASYCYYNMFKGCTSLTTAPALPATTLSLYCYGCMFSGCTSLTTAPALPATNLSNAQYCYYSMFRGCTNLTTAPELPATVASRYCYQYMFADCTMLTRAPEKISSVDRYSCSRMFLNCTNLKTAPELPVYTISGYCYEYMFYGCTNLNYIKCTAGYRPSSSSYDYPYNTTNSWVYGVSDKGIFVKYNRVSDSFWSVSTSGIPYGWSAITDSDIIGNRLNFIITSNGNICWKLVGNDSGKTIEYRKNNENWVTITSTNGGVLIPVLSGDSITFRGKNLSYGNSTESYSTFSGTTCGFKVSGNILSLSYEDPYDYISTSSLTSTYMFYKLFEGCTGLTDASNLFISPESLSNYCYAGMFEGCINLNKTPSLSSTALATGCYYKMFAGCSSLVKAPFLPAVTLPESCYERMFENCTSLSYIKCFATNITAQRCTYNWVDGVASSGTFLKDPEMSGWTTGTNGVPYGWSLADNKTEPLTFEIISSGNITFSKTNTTLSYPIEYKKNDDNWTEYSESISVVEGDILKFRGNNPTYCESATTGTWDSLEKSGSSFYGTASFNVQGNIMSLISASGFSGITSFESAFTFAGLFSGTKVKDISNLYLPAEQLTPNCYYGMFASCSTLTNAEMSIGNARTVMAQSSCTKMFSGCISLTKPPRVPSMNLLESCYDNMFNDCSRLTTAPELPATTLANGCYRCMFCKCSGLTEAPELPASVLAQLCYNQMFAGCKALTAAPELTATTLANGCYSYMFSGCSNLTTAPVLPASAMADSCYTGMFYYCSNLTTAPVLPASAMADSCYYRMFYGCAKLTTAPELPATTLAYGCYSGMFGNCTSLTTAPALQATTLADYCYSSMFNGCTSLTTAPELPATTLASSCYYNMFQGCTSLTTAPELPATTLASSCYTYMFQACTNLTTAPELPASAMANSCYAKMFYNCTRLTTAPALPATTLAGGCYADMFYGCAKLTTAPELPATTLANGCYSSMFGSCTSLTTAPELPATTLADNCYVSMFSGCRSITTAPELPATTLRSFCYEYMFRGCTNLTTAPELPATTLEYGCYEYMFSGCTKLNYIKCLAEINVLTSYTASWTLGVASSGTFVKFKDVEWTNDKNGIPTGWTIQEVGVVLSDYEAATYQSGGTLFVTVCAATPWSASTEDSWITLPQSTGGVGTFSFQMILSSTQNIRKGVVNFYTEDNIKTLTITQDDGLATPLTFIITSGGNICWSTNSDSFTKIIEYSKNGEPWVSITSSTAGTNINVISGDELQFRGNNPQYGSGSSLNTFSGSTCGFNVKGNIMSLLNSTGFSTASTLQSAYTFCNLFASCTGLTDARDLVLPAKTLSGGCYADMFRNCTSLTIAPSSIGTSATTMAASACSYMFADCTSLTTAPELPSTRLASSCYTFMFRGCIDLTTAPSFLKGNDNASFYGMFSGCTSLTTAPLLYSYSSYRACCYMFYNCTSLNYVKSLQNYWSQYYSSSDFYNWLYGVSPTGTFVKHPDMSSWPSGANGIPSGWTVEDATL